MTSFQESSTMIIRSHNSRDPDDVLHHYSRYETSKSQDFDLTIVLPCLNEALTIAEVIKEIRKVLFLYMLKRGVSLNYEILVVDNGSDDGSHEIALRSGARVVKEGRRGYGLACRRGFKESRGSIVILMDADCTYDPISIPKMIQLLKKDKYDFIVGSRLRGTIERKAMPWHHRYLGNPVLTAIQNLLFSTRLSDAHCGLRAMKRDCFSQLRLTADGMELATEMLIEARQAGLKIGEVQVRYRARPRDSRSKLRSFRDGFKHLVFLVRRRLISR